MLAMGLFKMGFVTRFLSHPVLSGFTSAAALIIGFGQVRGEIPSSIYANFALGYILFSFWVCRESRLTAASAVLIIGFGQVRGGILGFIEYMNFYGKGRVEMVSSIHI